MSPRPRDWRVDWKGPVGWWKQWAGAYASREAAIHEAEAGLRGIARAVRVVNIVTGETWARRGGTWIKTREPARRRSRLPIGQARRRSGRRSGRRAA